ncbi:hypothetical protein [Pelagibacterium halotolerans]|uniref:hypothetical protein n=1 Tax=Pelagibacterium halotolerans TaxID=531813 RepID=UPI00384DCD2C
MGDHVVDGLGVVVTREETTVALYRKRLKTLQKRAARQFGRTPTLFDTIECFALSHEAFAPATIRQYAAALAWAIEEALERGGLDDEGAAACRERLAQRPAPRSRRAPPRTSARKRKAIGRPELHTVCTALRQRGRPGDVLLLRLLVNGITFGLRPCEFGKSDIQSQLLIVWNAKATNGRALSETREFDLEGLADGQVDSLRTLIADLEVAARGDIPRLIDRLGARLRRICKRLGVAPFSLYAVRHQAIANAKASGSAEEVAAFAGHASVHTARKFYAPKGKAWAISKTAKPTPDMVARVRVPCAAGEVPRLKI